jgi:hypothetical protein
VGQVNPVMPASADAQLCLSAISASQPASCYLLKDNTVYDFDLFWL